MYLLTRFRPIALTLIAVFALAGGWFSPFGAVAGPVIDPSALQPPPPPGAVCREDGPWVICQTKVVLEAENLPVFDLTCGTVYETSLDAREGIRWYRDGKLAKRFVTQDMDGTWSLSPIGEGLTVQISAHANWRNVYAIPGDDSSGPMVSHGDGFTAQAPGFGVIAHIAGIDLPDGTHRGTFLPPDDPSVVAELCAALGG